MKKLVTRYYYTLKDIVELDTNLSIYLDTILLDSSAVGIGTVLGDIYEDSLSSSSSWSSIDTTESKTMFNYLWTQFQDEVVLFIDVETCLWEEVVAPEDDDVLEAFAQLAPKIIKWAQESTTKYSKLISIQTNIASTLMNRLGSTNLTLFNDTPQEGGDFTSDPYVTNATKVTAESDVATPIARLKEIENNIRNYYSDWAEEFSRFVIYSA